MFMRICLGTDHLGGGKEDGGGGGEWKKCKKYAYEKQIEPLLIKMFRKDKKQY